MPKLYVVELTPLERKTLQDLISKGRTSAMKQRRARILLKADVGPEGPGWTDQQIADNLALNDAPSVVKPWWTARCRVAPSPI